MEENLTGKVRAEYWREIINDQLVSDMSGNKYCLLKGVSYKRFLYWQRKFRYQDKKLSSSLPKEETGLNFIPLPNSFSSNIVSEEFSNDEACEIDLYLPLRIKLRVSGVSL
ncbi:MAG TPA: hypothetical protein PKA63_11300 [Oligoflexia bacterium]|nr:hypothetical protein [Oligoflexia bacterium]HMP49244.1 hypothetical protein [Oligoflexia bacterium]